MQENKRRKRMSEKVFRTRKGFITEIEVREAIDRLLEETKPFEKCQLAKNKDNAGECAKCVLNTLKRRLGINQAGEK